MIENQTIKARLYAFIESQNLSVREFERLCGLSNAYVSNIRSSIQPDKLQKIALRFPVLNKGWLMTGEGTMLKEVANVSDSAVIVDENNYYHKTESAELIAVIRQQGKQIDELIELLKRQTEALTDK